MRKVLLLAVTVVTAVLAADQRCLRKADTESRNLRHETDCRKFYMCNDDNQALEHDCADGLEFNPVALECDIPQGFCENAMVSTAEEYLELFKESLMTKSRSLPAHIDCSSPQGGWFEDKTDCTRFYICIMGNALRQQCHSGQFYDASRKMCRTGTCTNKGGASNTNGVVTMSAGISSSVSCTEGAVMPSVNNADVYYKCLGTQFREIRCDAGKIYSATAKNCVSSVMTKPATLDTVGACTEGAAMPSVSNADVYYKCLGGQFREIRCDAGKIYSETAKNCVSSVMTKPATLDTVGACTKYNTITGACEIDSKCTTGEVVPNAFNNATYFVCQNNYLVLVSCEAGSYFNPTTKNCTGGTGIKCTNGEIVPNYFNNATYYVCQNNVLVMVTCEAGSYFDPVAKNCTGSGTGSECTNGEIYADTADKTKFYVCYDGKLRSQSCPDRMKFNSLKKYCELSNSPCGNTPHGGFQQAIGQPDKFYVCVDGDLILELCPEGQLFNPMLGYCSVYRPDSTTRPTPAPTAAPSLNCGAIQQGQFVPDPADETRYFICVLGKLWPQQCDENMVFNANVSLCVNVPATPSPGGCGEFNSGQRLPICVNGYDQYYLVCAMGVFIVQKCPDSYTYNPTTTYCEVGTTTPNGCGSLPEGSVWQLTGSAGNAYQQCLNGSAVNMTCPDNLIFNSQANYCMNPCSAISGDGNVMDPNNNSSYYTCKADEIDSIDPTPCPPGQSFFQALVGIDEYFVEYPAAEPANYADGCIASSIIDTCPPGNAFANVPVYPLDDLTKTTDCSNPPNTDAWPLTNFYVECYQGQGSLQKCPLGYIMFEGACLNADACAAPTPNPCTCL